jgi:hypothetical protein
VHGKDVAREGFAPRGPAQEQRQLAIRFRVTRQVVINDESVAAAVHPELGDRAAGERGQMLQPGQAAGLGHDDGRIGHGPVLTQRLDRRDGRRALLTDEHVDAVNVPVALIDDGIECERAPAETVVSEQELALAFADRDQRIDDLDARIERLAHELPGHDWRRGGFETLPEPRLWRRRVVERQAERIDDAPEQLVSDRQAQPVPRAVTGRAGSQGIRRMQQHGADSLACQIEYEPVTSVLECQNVVDGRRRQARYPRDAVADGRDMTSFLKANSRFVFLEPARLERQGTGAYISQGAAPRNP